ncbi:MAG: hypothetical protein IJM92_04630 [Fibrobacter sp.]|uniref:hypothetical protein n=1 Tax=Fibrobacter sp. TaxID=35828 RepID=UPI0025B93909|nr:hypothetical protein [Fibrobacter sp.]MBQ7078948.1 hypothetical protein [Fibrobacter sp.]
MKLLKILPLIAIALLAACKSTVPQSESLLEERVSTAQENSSSSLELPVKSDKDSTVIFERIKSYVFDSVMTDMTTNFTVMEHICCVEVPSDLLSWCEVKYDSTQIHLNMTSRDETYQFNLKIENGIAFAQKTYSNLDQEKIKDLCTQHKSDSTKKNVACENNAITFAFKDDFSGYDLRQLSRNLLHECDLITSKPSYSCAWWVKFPCERMERNKETPPLEDDL